MRAAPPRTRPPRLPRLLDAATLGVLALAGWLLLEPRLRTPAAPPSPAAAFPAPDTVPPIPARDTAGRAAQARGPGPTLLLLFRSDCPACARQREGWRALAREADARGWCVVALTGEPLAPHVAGYLGDAPATGLRAADEARAYAALAAPGVPTTVAVGADGRVAFHRVGVLPPAADDSLRGVLARPPR